MNRSIERADLITGLVFDLPHGPWMADVLRLRSKYEPARLRFPIEITVVGSSGLGWFSPRHDNAQLVRRVGEVAAKCTPFSFHFESVRCFPNTCVYYLSPRESRPFVEFQEELRACGLSYETTPFAYTPHCTIVSLVDANDDMHSEVMSCHVPEHEIRVTSVSFYTVDRQAGCCYQRDRVNLGT